MFAVRITRDPTIVAIERTPTARTLIPGTRLTVRFTPNPPITADRCIVRLATTPRTKSNELFVRQKRRSFTFAAVINSPVPQRKPGCCRAPVGQHCFACRKRPSPGSSYHLSRRSFRPEAGRGAKELWMSVVPGLTTPGIGSVDPPSPGNSTEPT